MPSGSLIPDRQLTFSPELAETIGLEEAILLQALGYRSGQIATAGRRSNSQDAPEESAFLVDRPHYSI